VRIAGLRRRGSAHRRAGRAGAVRIAGLGRAGVLPIAGPDAPAFCASPGRTRRVLPIAGLGAWAL
jgi:hypothetical protein